ncbi:hypothetical protein DFJ77DRAFT_512012 [Powellomyces hirtus]|nr:hypothetical protein DFJ77DRAFT_512012 [Powellomyces hirtus]
MSSHSKAPVVPSNPFIEQEFGSVEGLLEFCHRLPKLELHAHVNGSIPPEALRQLAEKRMSETVDKGEAAKGALSVLDAIAWKSEFDIKDFFPLFKHIYGLTNDPESLTFVMHSVITDFENDGVRYIELRSTPRDDPSTGLTKDSYIQSLLSAISTSPAKNISVKLIVSIDRRHTPEVAQHIVDLAIKYRDQGVVGIDLCGDPYAGDFDAGPKDAIVRAKAAGLKVTLHLAEIQNRDEENRSMLSVFPDRLGHATYMSDDVRDKVYKDGIPIEMCMTSNVLSRTVESYEVHHIKQSLEENHPSVLCTDDKGIISSPLSYEYALAASTFSMTKRLLYDLSRRSINAIFADDIEKARLADLWQAWADREFSRATNS